MMQAVAVHRGGLLSAVCGSTPCDRAVTPADKEVQGLLDEGLELSTYVP